MRLKSLDQLDLDRSWQRVLHTVREAVADVPDRLPFEVMSRFWEDAPSLDVDHMLQGVSVVMATKPGGTTLRPFVRMGPRDLLLYQALVDGTRDVIEEALPGTDTVFSYRLSPIAEDDPFENSPRWRDFRNAARELCEDNPRGYVIDTDVSAYFLGVQRAELERRLLEVGADSKIARDLTAFLNGLQSNGITGLPQGVAPSSPLGNLYLRPLDRWLESSGLPYARYMDDLYVVCDSYHEARQALDAMEGVLYEDGLSFGGAKTFIRRSIRALSSMTTVDEDLDDALADMIAFAGSDYGPTDDEVDEVRIGEVRALFDRAVEALEQDDYRRQEFTFALQTFSKKRDPHGLPHVPEVLLRMPGLTSVACGYLSKLTGPAHRDDLVAVLQRLAAGRFHRAQEWLHLLRVIQVVPGRGAKTLAERAAEVALDPQQPPLVRARALLAWGAQSAPKQLKVADAFVASTPAIWQPYAIIATQRKDPERRDARYARWARRGSGLAWLAESVSAKPFAWSKL